MIGILAKLAKAAKLAQTAEAAIDVASNRLAPNGNGKGRADSGASTELEDGESEKRDDVPADYRALLDAGVPDARELLSLGEAAQMIGKRIRSVSLAATDDCLVCDYHCKDRAGTVLGLHVSRSLPWEGFDSEIVKKEIFDDLGDAAFRGGRQIYVKCGDATFWIHTAGEVMVDTAVEAARLVVTRLRSISASNQE